VAIADVRDDDPRAPPAPLEVLQRQAVLYGYQDPDPAHNYLGLRITAGTQHHCTFTPFDG
jgi:hypothetical protein